MAEQVHRIVLDHADQGETECERDPVHAAKRKADRRQSGQASGRQRQRCQQQDARTAIRDQQQQQQADRIDDADDRGLVLGAVADQHRERAGTADRQCARTFAGNLRKRILQVLHGGLLALRIETGGACFHEQQRALAIGREPQAIDLVRFARRLPAFGQRQRFQRRIRWHQRFDHRRGRRAQVLQALLQLRVQVRRVETLGVERRRKQIAIGAQALGDRV